VLAPCATDQQCETDHRCYQVDACQELRELYWTVGGWSALPNVGYSRAVPGPPPAGPAPKAWVTLHVCEQDGPCNAPAECRPQGLCVAANAVGKTKAKIVAAAPVAEALPAGVDPYRLLAPDQASRDHSGAGGGCRKGCTVASTNEVAGWLALPLLTGLALWRRRERARSDPRATADANAAR
jgi:MYXO-CTERM domain-containing protein